ncbi:MAG: acyl-CoA dehydrogenase family protein [Myxococcales bacterium]|nr:acyl-CoA dehydrogenase family protein [Myxococcales bacterium]MCB9715783.1 acyl-CoA dehydrogenase family protein [Myxococcales bacterium]
MRRTLFSEEHAIYRDAVRRFVEREVVPHQERWREAGTVDREAWRKAGDAGLLCPWLPEEHGGPGGSFLHSVVVMEELARVYESGFATALHSDIIVPYIHSYGSKAQKARWLPGCASGEVVTAIGMTEPGTGSDLANIQTRARRDGDHWVLDGSKTFISNGLLCDLCIVAAKTEEQPEDPHRAISLFLVPASTPGFVKGRKLAKMGMASQDTAELFFEDCRIPADHLLGAEGAGFMMLMQKLAPERLVVAITAQAAAEQVLTDTIAYTKQREAFGRPISKFQNTRFVLAGCATEVEVGRAFLDRLITEHMAGQMLIKECSMAKLWHSEMLGRVTDACLQLFGGYGYMLEYPVTRAFMDARVQRIYAGTSEIMKVIIAKQLGL